MGIIHVSVDLIVFIKFHQSWKWGIYKVRNEIETKRNETISMKWNETKQTKTKRNQQKQNEIEWYEENGRKKIKDKTKKRNKKKW